MDLTTIVGIVGATVVIVFGIEFKDLELFVDPGGLLIVMGGTFGALIACFPLQLLKAIPLHLKMAVKGRMYDPLEYIDSIAEFATIARKSGLLALEEKATELEDPFLKQGLFLIVDAIDSDKVKILLESDLNYLEARHEEGISLYERGAAFAPAFGMVGTLIGLIKMLGSLDLSDAAGATTLTAGMSLALVTTFYGVLLANLLFTPIASKLKLKHGEEILCKEIVIEGILSIQSGENPKFIKEKLLSFLEQKSREQDNESEGGKGGKKGKKPKKEKAPKKEKK